MNGSSLRQTAASVVSVALAFVASSHHWLHMTLLYLFGGSMASMAQFLWLRRLMIVVVLVTAAFTLYRMIRHRRSGHGHSGHRDHRSKPWMMALHLLSAAVSIGFVGYTLYTFGW